jgi:hypothetical protein
MPIHAADLPLARVFSGFPYTVPSQEIPDPWMISNSACLKGG